MPETLAAVIKNEVVATTVVVWVDENWHSDFTYPGADEVVFVRPGQVALIGGTYKDGEFQPPVPKNIFGM